MSVMYMLCVFQLCALALLAVGIWIMVDPKAQNIVNVAVDSSDSDSELLKIAAILLIVVAALLLIISLIGIIGAAFEYKVLLGIVRIYWRLARTTDFTLHLCGTF